MSDAPPLAGRVGEDRAPRMTVLRWLTVGAILVAITLAIVLRPRSSPAVPAARVARRDLVVPILSDGSLEPLPGGELRAPEGAAVAGVLVKDGQRVSRGMLLVRLENPELARSAFDARSKVLQLAEERARTEAELDQQKHEAAYRKTVVEGDKRLLDASAIAKSTYEADDLAYRQALQALQSAQARLESLDGEGRGGRTSRLALAQEAARQLEGRLDALSVRAQTDGIVFGLPRKVGETVREGEVVASIADPEHLRVRARVDQPDLPRVAAGQRFLVTFDGLPGRRWEGRVLDVPAGVREAGGREVGEVLGEISDRGLSLPPNASVNVEIIVGERRSSLAVPRAALLREGDRRFVYRLEAGRARRREITVGLVGLNDVEVTGGLGEGDIVLLSGAAPLSDGLKVTAQEPRG